MRRTLLSITVLALVAAALRLNERPSSPAILLATTTSTQDSFKRDEFGEPLFFPDALPEEPGR